MDENNQNLVSQEEQNAEKEATMEVQESELREKIATDLGLDSEEDSELLDKLTERELTHREKLSGAIKQKITWREKFQSTTAKTSEKKTTESVNLKNLEELDALVDSKLEERFQARELSSLNYPEEVQNEVKEIAKIRGISVRDASQLPYIKSRVEEVVKSQRMINSTPKRSKSATTTPTTRIDLSKPLNPKDFKTPDGNMDVEAWNNARAERQRYIKENR